MPSTYEDLKDDIDRVAKSVARDYPDIEWEDLRQELVVFVLENGKSLKTREQGGSPRKILNLVAQAYSKKLRVQHLILSPQYSYRPSDVQLILETAWTGVSSASYVPDDARDPLSNTFTIHDDQGGFRVLDLDPFHMPDAMEVASDVKRAFASIKKELQESLFKRYALNEVPDNASWERKRLNKAVNELTYRLNSYKGDVFDPQKRKKVSSAAARVRFSQNYEDN